MKLAVIDIGSNSVRLMLWANGKSLYKRVNTTRLGQGIALNGTLSQSAMRRTACAVAEFKREAEECGAGQVYAFATAAVRSSCNGGEFCELVREICGLNIDVVAGEEEALLGLYGALGGQNGGIIDIGGASTEVCFQYGGKKTFSVSLDIGAVRLFDLCKDQKDKLLSEIRERIKPLKGVQTVENVYAVGGTASTLASVKLGLREYDAQKIQDYELKKAEVFSLAENLLALTAEERKNIAGMDIRRTDIIAGGALLLAEIMDSLALERLFVSDRDNLEGYLTARGLI